ncbi:uncharacterized protein BDV14DRAFT_206296 [Aspergillus stella-maris]|uniref:uncharacterized protein n=1 Tax=Aspergillus stella-maris TaxID=1810926 RepID=UPI003CCE32DA
MSTSTASHSRPQSQDPSSSSTDQNSSTAPSSSPDQQSIAVSAFTASLHSLGQNYTSSLVDRAKVLHENSAALESQEEELARTTANLAKQNNEWEKIADEARTGLKEIGDVQNWAELIERDLLVVEDVLAALEEDCGEERGEGRVVGDEQDNRRERVVDVDGDVDMETVNGNANVNATGNLNGGLDRNGDGKNGSAGRPGEAGKGKGKVPEKKGWFSWWW